MNLQISTSWNPKHGFPSGFLASKMGAWGGEDGPFGGGRRSLVASWVPVGAKMATRPLSRLILIDFKAELGGF